MKRKVVQQGPVTLMVSLPSKWVKENGIAKGDDIEVVEDTGKLIFSCENENADVDSREWHASDMGVFNEYFVNYFYQKGYDEVTVRYDDPKYTPLIEKRVRDLMGFEVVESSESHSTMKMLVKIDEQEFETVLRKLFQITLVMGDKLSEALRDKNAALLQEVLADEKENNRYCDLCLRILFKNRYAYPDDGFAHFALIRELEQIGDLYKYISQSSTAVSKEVLQLYNDVHAFFRLYYEIYYKYDNAKAEQFFSMKKELLVRSSSLISSEKDVLVVSYLDALIRAVFDLKGPMFLQFV
jgi:phosphate uptake regulator